MNNLSRRQEWFRTKPGERWLPITLMIWGLLVCLLVGTDGTTGWQIGRVAIVAAAIVFSLFVLKISPKTGALIMMICGIFSLVIAIVFGFRYFSLAGLSWRVIVGILHLAAGIILLIGGGRLLLYGIKRRWMVLAIPLILIVIIVLTWIITPAVLATNVPHIPVKEANPADFGLIAQEVHFDSADGVKLGAWYIPSKNGAAVVLRHGSGSTASSSLAHAAVIAKHGYGVLITDARGRGLSEGRAMDFGWYGDADIKGAVSFLSAQSGTGGLKIAVVGLSMGGEEAIGAMANDTRIAACVIEGVTARTETDKAWYKDQYGIRGRIQLIMEWAQYSIVNILTSPGKPKAMSECAQIAAPRPILLITAGEVEEEYYAATYIQQKSPENVLIWKVPEAGHIQGLSVDPIEWENKVISFLDKELSR